MQKNWSKHEKTKKSINMLKRLTNKFENMSLEKLESESKNICELLDGWDIDGFEKQSGIQDQLMEEQKVEKESEQKELIKPPIEEVKQSIKVR